MFHILRSHKLFWLDAMHADEPSPRGDFSALVAGAKLALERGPSKLERLREEHMRLRRLLHEVASPDYALAPSLVVPRASPAVQVAPSARPFLSGEVGEPGYVRSAPRQPAAPTAAAPPSGARRPRLQVQMAPASGAMGEMPAYYPDVSALARGPPGQRPTPGSVAARLAVPYSGVPSPVPSTPAGAWVLPDTGAAAPPAAVLAAPAALAAATAAPVASPPADGVFLVHVERTGTGAKLGGKVEPHLENGVETLRVTSVNSDGKLAQWNSSHPEKMITAGNYIVEVNGHSGITEMLNEITGASVLDMKLRRTSVDATGDAGAAGTAGPSPGPGAGTSPHEKKKRGGLGALFGHH